MRFKRTLSIMVCLVLTLVAVSPAHAGSGDTCQKLYAHENYVIKIESISYMPLPDDNENHTTIVRGTGICHDCGHEWPNIDRSIRRHVSDGSSAYLGCYEGNDGRYHLYSTACSQCGYEYTYTAPCDIHCPIRQGG